MNKTSRSLRRYHKRRMKKRALLVMGYPEAIKYADHLQACSCWGCGNPRKHFGQKSIQERKHDANKKTTRNLVYVGRSLRYLPEMW